MQNTNKFNLSTHSKAQKPSKPWSRARSVKTHVMHQLPSHKLAVGVVGCSEIATSVMPMWAIMQPVPPTTSLKPHNPLSLRTSSLHHTHFWACRVLSNPGPWNVLTCHLKVCVYTWSIEADYVFYLTTVVFLGEEGERRGRVTSDDVLDILAIFYYFSVLSAYVDS